ncbi:MAG: TRAP transporter small permease subunit [Halobacteriovoraceae bacterium]|nr:TRAP transporter small permease subunit [Halobacteriovoraceae bacterium]MBT5094761.1 TRAP transporter small permease subunit [Halobacteriovoraceae bacterium]
MLKVLKAIDTGIEKGSSWVLIFTVLLMLSLSVTTIVLRWFQTSLLWLDPLVRHLVFIATFLGGVLATGRGTHIGIDIIGKWLETKKKYKAIKSIRIIIALTSTLVLAWLISASWDFVAVEFKYGKPHFLGIHTGYLVSIIPVGLSLICYRFFYIFMNGLFGKEEAA